MSIFKRVLIIDDEDELNEMVTLRLQKVGFEVDSATDGASGLEKVKSFKPDVILLDINMPGMDGWEVCERLRSNPETKDLFIVVLTATRNFQKAKQLNVNRVVLKPFNYDEILNILKQ